jgi:dolichol-phosphate mannosyltransferase
MDADLSHDPQFLPDLVDAAATRYDVVLGSRYLNGVSVVNWPLRRIMLSSFANAYVRTITGLQNRDSTSGYRCWKRDALARLGLDRILSQRYAFMVETIFEAARLGCRIGEAPIVFIERSKGASKMTFRVLLESMIVPWRLVLRNRGRVRVTRGVTR